VPSSLNNQPSSEDQRNVVIATILVAVIMFVWMFYFGPTPAEQAGVAEDTTQQQTTQAPAASAEPDTAPSAQDGEMAADDDAASGDASGRAAAQPQGRAPSVTTDSITAAAAQGTARDVVVETDLYTAVLSTKGATIKRFTLKEYKEFNQTKPIQLIDTTSTGALAMAFTTPTSRFVDTRALYFDADASADTIRVEATRRRLPSPPNSAAGRWSRPTPFTRTITTSAWTSARPTPAPTRPATATSCCGTAAFRSRRADRKKNSATPAFSPTRAERWKASP